jgi:Domain of unknown function (DUF1844)
MAEQSEEGFKVTDRRRRDEDEAPRHDIPPGRTAPGRRPPAPVTTRTLADLFMMLATEAVVALGDAPDPATGQPERALPHAAEMIDILLLLRAKTEGNRSPEETQVLEDVLYDLQLRYVRATKSAG